MITIPNKYKSLFNSTTRYYIITGGRGSGKSFVATSFLTLLSKEKGHRVLFTRQTMTSAHLSIIPEFINKIDLFGLENEFDVTKNEITNNVSNSSIWFRGIKTSSGDQTANLKSLQGVTTWVLDEAEELIDEDVFDKIDFSIRVKGKQNRVILIMNPATKEHFIYKKFFEGMGVEAGFNGVKGDVTYIHTTYKDNLPNLSESFINNANRMRINNPSKYNHVMDGGWLDRAEGVVITNWEFGEFNPNKLQVTYGQDFGFTIDPTTLVAVAIDKKRGIIYVKELFYKTELTTTQIAALNLEHCGRGLIIVDSAEPRLINELKIKGCNVYPTKKGDGSINAGIELLKDYKIIVEPNSLNVAKEFNNYVYLDKGSKLYIDKYNHIIDALRYNVLFNIARGGGVDIRV